MANEVSENIRAVYYLMLDKVRYSRGIGAKSLAMRDPAALKAFGATSRLTPIEASLMYLDVLQGKKPVLKKRIEFWKQGYTIMEPGRKWWQFWKRKVIR